jgi:hypothetical protein
MIATRRSILAGTAAALALPVLGRVRPTFAGDIVVGRDLLEL